MRAVLFVVALVAAVWALDAIAFDGHYGQVAWQEMKYRGQQFNNEVRSLLRTFGLAR